MNDRFKFRVWDKQDECYAYSNNSDVDILYIETDGELTYGTYNNDYEDMCYTPESEVIVEQCVGLKDKNDKLIYDNDLIMIGNELYRVAIDDFGCRTVILDNNPFKEVIEWSDIVKTYYFYNRVDEIEVVGNIRENKDLLENKDESI